MLLFKTISQFAKNATKLFLILVSAVCLSNFFATSVSYLIGEAIYSLNITLELTQFHGHLAPAWNWQVPKLCPNDLAMGAALILSVVCGIWRPDLAKTISGFFDHIVRRFIRVLLWLVPFFLIGFVLKMLHERTLQNLFVKYFYVLLIVICAQVLYIGLLLLVANRMQWRKAFGQIRNIFPAALAGFGSMSSAAAMPLTIVAAEKNTELPGFARFVIPLTVNIHLLGDCLAIPILAFAIMKHFGFCDPSIMDYMLFAFYFVIAKFSVAAVPGGGILVMLPILEAYLGFTTEMGALITALYILFDPIITCANVCGNSAFAVMLQRLLGRKKYLEA
jgi:Na+/H+-dicarboxylate symporter